MRYFIRLWAIFILLVAVTACSSSSEDADGQEIITVQTQSFSNTLYYTGVIRPLKTVIIASPAEGVVVDMPFQYGEQVLSGQLLFILSSTKFLTDYKAALMQYIKAKSDFNTSQTQLSEAKFLHDNQLISDDEFKMKQSTFYGNRLALLQAKDALEVLIHQLDIKDMNLYNLTIADIDKITAAMHLQMSSDNNLKILASAKGIVLSPNKGEEENKKINKGDITKQGDILAMIGDMSGLSVRIQVNELTVNRLKLGQKVRVTGIAFPDDILQGEIKRIDRQGEISNGGMPTFSVEVIVPALTEKQQKEIHVGMSAKIEIDVTEAPQLVLPIQAIQEKDGGPFVKKYNEKTRKSEEVFVRTGKTTLNSVAILSGIKAGDKIVLTR